MEKAEGRNVEEGHSKELLNIGGGGGFYNQLLINPKYSNKQGSNSPITRMPRSSILDRVQNFLPQLAKANESLSKEIESSPVGTFDIEHVDEKEEKIIEMVRLLKNSTLEKLVLTDAKYSYHFILISLFCLFFLS
ncbi:hypothetical protein XENTR_v10008434 [Xenopus tropicalis]|nr:hypothetical protein XENTR_v10008434 [Xenopus tropicalis]